MSNPVPAFVQRSVTPVVGVPGAFVRSVNGHEIKKFMADCKAAEAEGEGKNVSAVYLLVNLCTCTDDGRRVWEDSQLHATTDMPIAVATEIFEAAMTLNKINEKKATN